MELNKPAVICGVEHALFRALPVTDHTGRQAMVCVVKVAFACDAGGVRRVSENVPPIDIIDTFFGEEPHRSSILRPSQLHGYKPGTDVVMLGHAYPPNREAVSVDVRLRMGPIDKTVRAFGARAWRLGVLGDVAPGPAAPMREPVPLVYEFAWGGLDMTDPDQPLAEPRNPAGRGVSRRPKALVDQLATQLEDPLRGPRHPSAFNPIQRHWVPRAGFAGTFDESWLETRMPLLPVDYSERFNNCVPDDQRSVDGLRGDERVTVENATPDGYWTFQLPRMAMGCFAVVSGRRSEHKMRLDTVIIDADVRLVECVWRAIVPIPRKLEMMSRIVVTEKTVVGSV